MRLARTWSAPVAVALIGLSVGAARAGTLTVDYDISLAGLPIGTADLATTLDGDRYRVDLRARLTGLAGALTGGKGAATATGVVSGARPLPTSFAISSTNGREERTVQLGLASGNVVAVSISPPLDDRPDRVPVRDVHKRGVVDPVSALLMPVFGRGEPTDPAGCNRTIPVFDGAARFNIVLSYAETRHVEKAGYRGAVIVCSARYVPIAGHRPERPATKYMQANRDISVWLAPVEGTRLLMPLRVSVRTMIGTSVLEASRWVYDRSAQPMPAATRARRATAE